MKSKFLLYSLILKHLWCLCESLYMVRYYNLSADFLRLTRNKAYPEDDPLNLENLQIRQSICDQVILARQYMVLSRGRRIPSHHAAEQANIFETLNFQRVEVTTQDPDPQDLRYSIKTVIFDRHRHVPQRHSLMIKLLECVRTPHKNWFVAFSGEEGRMFLIEALPSDWSVRVPKALIETRPKIDNNFRGTENMAHLFQYFSFLVENVPEKMTLCMLTYNEHIRLCAAAFDALSQPEIGHFRRDVRDVNHIHIAYRRCRKKWVRVMSQGMVKSDVIACPVNRYIGEAQFFMLADPSVPGSAFVMVETFHKIMKSLEVIARLEKIVVLLDREESAGTSAD